MRKTPYLISLIVVVASLTLSIISIVLPEWLYVASPSGVPGSVSVRYGLYQRCELRRITVPDPLPSSSPIPESAQSPYHISPREDSFDKELYADHPSVRYADHPSRMVSPTSLKYKTQPPSNPKPPVHRRPYKDYRCHPFPARSECQRDGEGFCVLWSTAGYASQLSLIFAFVALVALAVVSFRCSTRARRRSAWKVVACLVGLHAALQIVAMSIVAHLLRTSKHRFYEGTRLNTSFYLNVTSWTMDVLLIAGLVATGFAARAGHKWAAGRRGYYPIPG